MNLPDYLNDATKQHLQRQRLNRRSGNVNAYVCGDCGWRLVTTDLDEGVTPYLTVCGGCGVGMAQSAMYRIGPTTDVSPTHAWYRPGSLDGMNTNTAVHVKNGGLLLRELTADELAILSGGK